MNKTGNKMKRKTVIAISIIFFISLVNLTQAKGEEDMKLESPEFENGQYMPDKFSCDGKDMNPALIIENIPKETKSLALIVDDPDAPVGLWVHWVVFDIAPVSEIKENSIPGKQGINSAGERNYHGPCPPSGTHRYFFKVYALDTALNFKEGISKAQLENAMQGHILDNAELVGLYKRKR
jgi:Raf kinase inhibitor-like YbhB/YbcL family protein